MMHAASEVACCQSICLVRHDDKKQKSARHRALARPTVSEVEQSSNFTVDFLCNWLEMRGGMMCTVESTAMALE